MENVFGLPPTIRMDSPRDPSMLRRSLLVRWTARSHTGTETASGENKLSDNDDDVEVYSPRTSELSDTMAD